MKPTNKDLRPYDKDRLKQAFCKFKKARKITNFTFSKRDRMASATVYYDNKETDAWFVPLGDLLDIIWPDIMDTYIFVQNFFDTRAFYEGHMFEPEGTQKAYIIETFECETPPEGRGSKVWTYMQNEQNFIVIQNGLHRRNSLGYLISTEFAKTTDEFYYEPDSR